jgi:LuxR family transcriptional regulator, maltose regulon positive regulatory protein
MTTITAELPPLAAIGSFGGSPPLPGFRPQRTALAPSSIADAPASAMALRGWLIQSLLLEAIMRSEADDAAAAEHALERALELAEHDRVLVPFLVQPIPELLERHVRPKRGHADVIAEIFDLLAGIKASTISGLRSLPEPLTDSEARVLRLLATNLSKREIGAELCLSVNTIKTHVKHIYAKLDVQTRRQAVERARDLGLLSLASR